MSQQTAIETIEVSVDEGAARITLNRPESLNSWNHRFGAEMRDAVQEVGADPSVRAVLITGAGRAFSSGADLKGGFEPTDDGKPDVLTPLRELYNPIIAAVRSMPKPVITAVNGPAVGIGCSLALAADLIVAAESAYFLMAFANIGLTLDGGASALLAARVGHTRAAEMALLGERVLASEALDWGLVNQVVADEALAATAGELLAKLASGPTGSYAASKRLLNERLYAGFEEHIDLEATLQQERAASADFMEGAMSFVQKRTPEFRGE